MFHVFCRIFLISFSFYVNAAEYVPLQHISVPELTKLVNIILPDKQNPKLRFSENTLKFISKHTDLNQVIHTRLQQEYLGFPVFGGYAILHEKKLDLTSVNGAIYKNLNQDLGDKPPFTKKREQGIYNQFAKSFHDKNIADKHIEPIVYIDEQNNAFWAYKISISIKPTNSIPQKPNTIIDLKSGNTLALWDDIKTSHTLVKGVGFGGNQKIGPYQFGRQMPLLDISQDDFSGMCYMENQDITVVDMKFNYQAPNATMAFTCPYSPEYNAYWTGYDENGYDSINGAYSPSNDALYIGGIIKEMYKKNYGVDVLQSGLKSMRLIMRVHYGRSYANAFWDGQQMTFGDGDMALHPFVSLDIGAHEISHGFTEQNSNLSYFGQSGGMNESFSDMAAQAAQYYATKKNSWSIGNEILKYTHSMKAIRYMDKPSLDGRSIDYADQFKNGMDVHYSSGIYNRLFYLLATSPRWNTHKAFKVMLKANMDYWTPKSTFAEGACGVIYATEDLGLSVTDVKNVLDDVMINYDLC